MIRSTDPILRTVKNLRGQRVGDATLQGVAQREPVKATPRVSKLNKTETRYRDLLETRKRAGEIQDYFVQSVTLKLAEDTRYTPDFAVVENDSTLTFVEVKGWMRDDAQAKFRIARGMFWWARFTVVRYIGGEWQYSDDAQRDKRRGEA